MSEAIVYCDQCGRMIPHSEVMGGEALVSSDAFALCATCAASLTQEQRAAIIMRKSSAAIAAVKKRPRAPAAAAGAAGGPPPRRHARPPGQATASRRKSRASDRIPGQGRPAKPRSVAGFVILGGGMLVGVAIAVFALGRRPERPGKGSRKPPSARRRVAVPADQTPAPDAGGAQPQDTVSQPLVSDAAAGRLDKIRGMIEPTLGSYAEIVSGLEAFPDEFPGTTEAAKAKELLAKVKSDFSALAEGEFRAARELAAEGKHVQATSLLGSIQGRFSDSEWYRTRGKGEVEAALRDAKDAPAGGGQGAYVPGLLGEYYEGRDAKTGRFILRRVDASVRLDCGNDSPAPGVPADHFFARWTGEIQVPADGRYEFLVEADDVARVKIDGASIIATENGMTGGSADLKAGWRPVEIEFVEHAGRALFVLKWSGPGFGVTEVSTKHLRTPAPKPAATAAGGPGRITEGLVGHWKFDEGRGVVARDSSGRKNHGKIRGAKWAKRRTGGALQFDGKDDYVDCGTGIDLAGKSFTLSAWARRTGAGAYHMICGQGVGVGDRGLHFGFRPTNEFTFAFWGNDLDTPTYTDSKWHHWAGTYDATTNARNIYRDGVQVASGTAGANFQGTGAFWIGRGVAQEPISGGYFVGVIDDVRIYNRALSAAEIAAVAAQARVATPARVDITDGLVGHWKLDEAGGGAAADSSGKGNDGTLTNVPDTAWTVGRRDGALRFDGTGGHINCGRDASLNTKSLTVAFWMKAGAMVDGIPVDRLPLRHGAGWTVKLRSSGSIWFRIGAEYGNSEIYGAKGLYAANTWMHVAATYDQPSGAMKLYVNAVERSAGTAKVALDAPLTDVKIGTGTGSPEHFKGTVDDVRIYDRALIAAEIGVLAGEAPATAMSAGSAEGLIAWWRFDEKAGTAASDSSGRGNDGQLKGMTGTEWTAGRLGGALRFGDDDDHVDCGTGVDLANKSFSLTAWAKKGAAGGLRTICAQGTAEVQRGLNFAFRPDGAFTFAFFSDDLDTGTVTTDSEWHHWAGTYDAGTKQRRIYRDGVEVGSDKARGNYRGSGNFYVGTNGRDGSFLGVIDDVRVYERVLRPGEITALARGDASTAVVSRPAPMSAQDIARFRVESVGRPDKEGYLLNSTMIRNLKELYDKDRVKPKKLTAVGGPVAAGRSFDGFLRKKLKSADGYSFAHKMGMRGGNFSAPAALETFKRRLARDKPELVRICFDASNLDPQDSAQALEPHLASYVKEVIARGAIPVLFTVPAYANPNDPKQRILQEYNRAVLSLAGTMKVPCVDAWTILNGDKAQLSKRFDKRGNLRTGGYDAVNERVLRLYFILEHWVMGRDRPFAGRIAEPQETRAQPADAAAAAPTPDTKTPEAPEAAEAAPVANLAVNGGFEVVDAHTRFAKSWKAHQWGEEGLRYSVRIDKSDPRTGKRAVLARGFADGAKSGAYTTFTLKAGRYEVSYWASTDRDETVRVGGQLAGRDLAEKTVGGEYQQIKEIVEIPEKQIGASLRLWTVGKGRAWFDDVEVRSVP